MERVFVDTDQFAGYSEKLPMLVAAIVRNVRDFSPEEDLFRLVMGLLDQDYSERRMV